MSGTSPLGMQVVPPGGTASKHRETQLQLQRKLQEREVIREQKRKLQVRIVYIFVIMKVSLLFLARCNLHLIN